MGARVDRIILLARARKTANTGMLDYFAPSELRLPMVAHGCLQELQQYTNVGWHLTPRVYYKLNLGNVPLESSSGWSTRLTTSTALMFFFFMIQVWKEL